LDRFIATAKVGNTLIIEGEELKHILAKRVKVGQELELFLRISFTFVLLKNLPKKMPFAL
jgi:16S rRNA (uracil1498-N3)-methyltransferase